MQLTAALAFALLGSTAALQLPIGVASRAGTPLMQFGGVRPPSWNPFENLKQMADQRVARISHCMLAAGTDMTLADAKAKIEGWKAEVGNDEAKFIELVKRESECEKTKADGGAVGIFSRGKLSTQLDELIFKDDVKPVENGGEGGVVRGPIGTAFPGCKPGLSLIYVHTCWEPMQSGVVGALLDPPESLKNKMNKIGK